jgi:hypothetical protein
LKVFVVAIHKRAVLFYDKNFHAQLQDGVEFL